MAGKEVMGTDEEDGHEGGDLEIRKLQGRVKSNRHTDAF